MNAEVQVLVLGTADWNQPIATNQHYMVREIAKALPTTFVESLGLRKPELKVRDLRRMASRLPGWRSAATTARELPQNVTVISPRIIPMHEKPWVALNQRLLSRSFRNWRAAGQRIFWTYSPVTYGFEAFAHAGFYHCVDLYGQFPGIDADLIDREERRLATTGVQAIGSSEIVVEHLQRQGFKDIIYWPNVADTETITNAIAGANNSRDGALFAGNLSLKKVDFNLLMDIVESGVTLHLAGPIAEGGGASKTAVEQLTRAGAFYHGVLSLRELSLLMSQRKVGLIPYLRTPYTAGVSPLKTYEYLAAGLAVVSTGIPGVQVLEPHVFPEINSEDFVLRVKREVMTDPRIYTDERARIAHDHSWAHRGAAARNLVLRDSRDR